VATPGKLVAIYPGSFDPITNGHLDLIERSVRLVDRLVVSILRNERKQALFSVQDRMDMVREVVSPWPNVEVDFIRGIRAISDYEYEWQMALMNRRLRPQIETMFLMAGEAYSYISSNLVKEVIRLGGEVSDLVPPVVEERLRVRFNGARV
jgi:pantetheine-phosphate adenylyltransferase